MMSENAGRTRTLKPLSNPVMGYGRRGSSASSGSSSGSSSDNQEGRSDGRSGGRSDGRSDGISHAWPAASTAAAHAQGAHVQSSSAFTRKNFSGTRAGVPCHSDVDMPPADAAAAADAPRGGSSAPSERLGAMAEAAVTHRLVPRAGSRSASSLPPPPPLCLPPPPPPLHLPLPSPLQRFAAGVRPRIPCEPSSVTTPAAATAFGGSTFPATAAPSNVATAAAFEQRLLASTCERDRGRDSASIAGDLSDDDLVVDVDDANVDGQHLNNAGVPLTAAQQLVAAAGGERGALHTNERALEATSCTSPAADVACSAGHGQYISLTSSSHGSRSSGGAIPHAKQRGFAASGGSDGGSSSSSGRGSTGEQCPSASSGRVDSSLLPPEVEKRGDDFADDYGGTGDADFADFYDDDEWSDAYDVSEAASFLHDGGVSGAIALADGIGVQEKKRRRGKCGRCPACQIKVDCGRCRYCVHKKVLKQSCLMRKCRYLIHKNQLQRHASRLAAMRDNALARSGPMLSHSLFGSGGRHQPEAGLFEHRKQQQQRLPPTAPLLPPTVLLQPGRVPQPMLHPLEALSQQQSELFLPRLAAPKIHSMAQSSRQIKPSPISALRPASTITRSASPTAVLCPDTAMTVLPYHAFIELPLSSSAQTCGSRLRRASTATAAATAAAAGVNEETIASPGLLSPPVKCELRPVSASALEDLTTGAVARVEAKSGGLLLSSYYHEQQQQLLKQGQHSSLRQSPVLPSLVSPAQTLSLEGHPALTGRRRPRKSKSPRPLRSTPWEPNEATCDEDMAEDDAAGGCNGVGKRSLLCASAEPDVIIASAASCMSNSLVTTTCRGDNEDAGDRSVVEQASGSRAVDGLEMRKSTREAADDDAVVTRLSPQLCRSDRSGVHLKTGAVSGMASLHSSDHSRGRRDKGEQQLPCDLPEGVPSALATVHCDLNASREEDCRRLHESFLEQSIKVLPSVVAVDCAVENLHVANGVRSAGLDGDDVFGAASGSSECSGDGVNVSASEKSHSASAVCGQSEVVGADASAAEGLSDDTSDKDCGDVRVDVSVAERAFDEHDVGSCDGVDVGPIESLSGASCCSDVVAVDRSRNFPVVGGGSSIAEVCTAVGDLCGVSYASADGVGASGVCSDIGASGESNGVGASGSERNSLGASEAISAALRKSFGSFTMDDRDSDVGDVVSVDQGYDGEAGILSLVVAVPAADGGALEGMPGLVLGPRSYEQEMALELKSTEFVALSDDFSQAIFDGTSDAARNSPLEACAEESPASHPVASDGSCVPGQGADASLGCEPISRSSFTAAVGSAAANVASCDAPLSYESVPPSQSIGKCSTVESSSGNSSSSFSAAGDVESAVLVLPTAVESAAADYAAPVSPPVMAVETAL